MCTQLIIRIINNNLNTPSVSQKEEYLKMDPWDFNL